LQVAVKAVNGWTGTVALTMGSQSLGVVNVGVTGGNNVWLIIRVPLDKNLFPLNWVDNGINTIIKLNWVSGGSGQLLVDDFLLVPFKRFRNDGGWYCISPVTLGWHLNFIGGGDPVPFTVGDKCTLTNTSKLWTKGFLQYWYNKAFGAYLPSSDSPTIADPAA
jgi:hypothetical protein